ncbi:glucose-1-phosphate adenylyltransferase [Culicoidibacter larvae]|uniref:Glucose-1-phosphate adenylyltransferase n=1 Tax=Culicoidibacter larvae TaxID=2579976 RepID=A0A5R8QCE2_9FIRM|nr:glucose-1-phosphate adenylyltransferase [Culicoidibacter larvae]TLG74241.1 glucose-1-phosphate adenylyltransferase [Culicoidibacter larvae]
MIKKEIVAMLLAGGQGSRLHALTKKTAKPAVPFGGRYRIIDFTLSNCANSGIDTVGVLTQYRPFELNSHIADGSAWDLNRIGGGVYILPPYMNQKEGTWYRGTAHAIYQNIDFVDRYNPENVIILSGDHIYKMDYSKMLDAHNEKNATCTIAVIEVPWEEASRFGIMNTDRNYRIEEFDEKPEKPKSNLASMGVYIFNWQKLRSLMLECAANKVEFDDFGQNIIPLMLERGEAMYAYPFGGYWKDVGTIESYWEANLEIIDPNHPLKLQDRKWVIYGEPLLYPPQYISKTGQVENSLVMDGCKVHGLINNSVLFPGSVVGKGAVVKDSILMANCVIEPGAVIEKAIIMPGLTVEKKVKVGDGKTIKVFEG